MSKDIGYNVAATLIVTIFAWLGGLLVQLLKGLNPPEVFPNWRTRPILKTIVLPSLFGQILFGCIARNSLYVFMNEHYNENLSNWIQMLGNLVLFVRSGLELEFKSKGLLIIMLTTVPLVVEACVVGEFLLFFFFTKKKEKKKEKNNPFFLKKNSRLNKIRFRSISMESSLWLGFYRQ